AEVAGEIDLVYEATGASTLSFEVLKYLGVNGAFVFTGIPGRKTAVRLDSDRVMRQLVLRNQVLLGTVNAGRSAYESAVRDLPSFMQHWRQAVSAMTTTRVTMDDAPGLLAQRTPGIKFVVSPDAI